MFDIDLYLALLKDLGDRLKHDDPAIQKAAETDYERCARAPNFAAALMQEAPHASAAREALRSDLINAWERRFLGSLVHYSTLSPKQQVTLQSIVAKARGAGR